MVGNKFKHLTVFAFDRLDKRRQAKWLCNCICGRIVSVNGNALRRGKTTSCGCKRGGRTAMTGQTFNNVRVIKFDRVDHNRQARWWCECLRCGNIFSTLGNSIARGLTTSCGCLKAENLTWRGGHPTHGESGRGRQTKEYRSWRNMITRCLNKNTPYYKNYGGRGITVCKRWQKFENFLSDMGRAQGPKLSIDRIDNEGGYWCGKCEQCLDSGRPMNCQWKTRQRQNRNRRGNRLITFNGETHTLQDWAEKIGLTRAALSARLENGWPLEKTFSQPMAMRTRHGRHIGSKSPEYVSWQSMLLRCRDKRLKRYGGRGITVCERWLKFENFLADMGPRPKGLTLDRIDNNGNYEPGNCRWATRNEQSLNKARRSVSINSIRQVEQ